MDFEGFSVVNFPPINRDLPRFVYVLFCISKLNQEMPFYVGQTSRIWGRLDDYYWAEFGACTDFRVGEAVRYLCNKEYRIVMKYRECLDSRKEETEIIKNLGREKLLNGLSAYNYKTADESEQRVRVEKFLTNLLFI